jgi:site-specific recombinase XerD
MATIHYIIRGEKRELVQIYIRHSSVQGRVKTGFKIEPERWSNETETVRQRKLTDTDRALIQKLDELKAYVKNEDKLFVGERTTTWLQGIVNKFHGLGTGNEDLNSYVSDFIKRMDSGELKNKGAINYVKGVVRSFRGFQGVFRRYQGMYTDEEISKYTKDKKELRPFKPVDFADITESFYRDFVKYLSDEEYEVNTIGRFIKQLKQIMHRALIEKKHNNREYEEFNVVTSESHAIYLTLEEIDKLWLHKCDSEREEIARDCFIVLCETALRISDYEKISIGIRGNFIDIYQKKTSVQVSIPLTSRMRVILQKYNGKLPYIHENYVNKYIKTVAFREGLIDKVTWIAQKKGMKFEKSAAKWTLVMCHTGRRSAATNMHLAGVDLKDISVILGHKSIKTTERYIKSTIYDTANRLLKHSYYNRNLNVV